MRGPVLARYRRNRAHFDGTRAGRNFQLDRQVEPLVLESEISGLADLHAFNAKRRHRIEIDGNLDVGAILPR